tara:strand:- start:232 stop:585 length:354 start_codon:yes stop_codon:yes gene_type:complete
MPRLRDTTINPLTGQKGDLSIFVVQNLCKLVNHLSGKYKEKKLIRNSYENVDYKFEMAKEALRLEELVIRGDIQSGQMEVLLESWVMNRKEELKNAGFSNADIGRLLNSESQDTTNN